MNKFFLKCVQTLHYLVINETLFEEFYPIYGRKDPLCGIVFKMRYKSGKYINKKEFYCIKIEIF
jgi:hypothetical protein